MKAVPLAFYAFKHRVVGESPVLRSDNTTVMVYLKKQGGTVGQSLYRLAQEVIGLTGVHVSSTKHILGRTS